MSKKINTQRYINFNLFSSLLKDLSFLLVIFFTVIKAITYSNYYQGREVYFNSDDAIYALLAQRIVAGDFWHAFHPYWNIGFPIATIPMFYITGSWEKAQVLLSFSSHILLVFIIYFVCRTYSRLLGVLASFLIAFSPSFTKLTTLWGTTEPYYIAVLWVSLLFGWKVFESQKKLHLIFTGIFFGIAYLTRTEVMYTLTIYIAYLFVFQNLKIKNASVKNFLISIRFSGIFLIASIASYFVIKGTRKLLFSFLFFATFLMMSLFEFKQGRRLIVLKNFFVKMLLIMIPFIIINFSYFWYISHQLGKPTLSGKYSFVGSGHPFTPEKRRVTTWAQDIWSIDFPNYNSPYYESPEAMKTAWKYLDSALDATYKKFFEHLSYFAHGNIFYDFDAALMILGTILGLVSVKLRKFIVFLLFLNIGSLLAVSYSMDMAYRYTSFMWPLLVILEVIPIYLIAKHISTFTKKTYISKILLTTPVVIFMLYYSYKFIDPKSLSTITYTTRNQDQKMIGDWIYNNNIKLFMGRTEALMFYGNAQMVYVPAATPETIIEFAKAWGVEYIVSRPNESSWSYMKEIVNPEFKHPDLKLIHKFSEGSLVWKVNLTDKERYHNYRTDRKI